MKSKKAQQRATNTRTQTPMAEQLSGALPLQHKRPDTGVFIDAHGREGSNGTNLIKVLILFCFLFFCSVSCNRERLSCEPGRFGFNDTNAIMRLKKNYLPMFLLQELVSLTWQWTSTRGIRKVQKVKDFAENPLGILALLMMFHQESRAWWCKVHDDVIYIIM